MLVDGFVATDTPPLKLLKNCELIASLNRGVIPPLHVQFNPTNRCNLSCSFCSCARRDRSAEADFSLFPQVLAGFVRLGTRALTFTGGGEPLLHPNLNDMVWECHRADVKTGLITNGIALSSLESPTTWCRVSHADYRPFTDEYADQLALAIHRLSTVDWAFSYVVSAEPNLEQIQRVVRFARDHGMTHVRLADDILAQRPAPWAEVARVLHGVDSQVIYQPRQPPHPGGDCYLCYLKPLIDCDYRWYACCTVQYALATPSLNNPPELCLGSSLDAERITSGSLTPFNGHHCAHCRYGEYNRALARLIQPVVHPEFL